MDTPWSELSTQIFDVLSFYRSQGCWTKLKEDLDEQMDVLIIVIPVLLGVQVFKLVFMLWPRDMWMYVCVSVMQVICAIIAGCSIEKINKKKYQQ